MAEKKTLGAKILSAVRADSWANMITGLGKAGMDKRLGATITWTRRSREEFESLYAQSDTARKITDSLPFDGLREGWSIPTLEPEQQKALAAKVKQLRMTPLMLEAWTLARMHGGAVMMINTRGSADLSQPLQPTEILTGFTVYSRWELVHEGVEIDQQMGSENYGRPVRWRIQPDFGTTYLNQSVHWTRFIFFDGSYLPRRLFVTNGYWHDSLLNSLENPIRNYETAHDSCASILQDFNVGVWKMRNLAELVAAGQQDVIKQRIEVANYGKSVLRSVILDESESYDDKARTVTGMPELLRLVAGRLVAASDMPHTKLLGESPSGSNATGASTVMGWNDVVRAQQTTYLQPRLIKALRMIDPKLPQELDPIFHSLWQLDEKEQAELRKAMAIVDDAYIAMGALDTEEVRESRFGSGKLSLDTKLLERPKIPAMDPSEEGAAVAASGGVDLPKDLVLNGAQVTALTGMVTAVAQKQIPAASAIAVAVAAYNMTPEQARQIIAPADAFQPAPPPAAATPPAPKPGAPGAGQT